MARIAFEAKHLMAMIESSSRFEKCMRTLKIDSLGKGKCTASLMVSEEHTNPMGTMHGGFSASLVDSISSWALLTHEKGNCFSVSVNMNMTYLQGAKEGEAVQVEANTIKVGRTLAFLEVFIKNKSNGNILVRGEHTKFLKRE